MGTAHIYCRVSTANQDLSPEWQAQVCQRYYESNLKARGFDLNPVIYEDRQSAYETGWADREAGRELFKAVKPGDVIIAAKQDRVWRSVRDRENCLFFLTQMGIELVILDMSLDTTTASGRFAAGIVALQAQWESDVRSERMLAAKAVRRKRKVPGRAHPPPGWKWDKEGEEFLPDIKERKLLAQIYAWRESRVRSVRATCKFLNEEGVRRANGSKYAHAWVIRAYRSFRKNWPLEGYQLYDPFDENSRLKKPNNRRCIRAYANEPVTLAELELICGALPTSPSPASQPDES